MLLTGWVLKRAARRRPSGTWYSGPGVQLLACGTLASLAITLAPRVRAQDADGGYGARARVRAPIAATNAEDPAAAGSTFDLRDRKRALEELSEVLVDSPGLRVNSAGGTGGFSGVSLRGAEVGHTAVLLGAIPLNTPDTGAFDFSVLPLSAFERLEVYRGGAPAWYNEGAIGGVVRLSPAVGARDLLQATAGIGSFGQAEVRGTAALARYEGLSPSLLGHVRLQHADNDYAYVDDGQTRFDPSDDGVLRQQNAEIDAGDLFIHGGIDALGGRLTALLLGHLRDQGIPGPLAAPTRFVNRRLLRIVSGIAYAREQRDADGERKHRLQLVLSGTHQNNQLRDLKAELGKSKNVDSDDDWQRAYVRLAGGLRVLPFLEPTLVVTGSADAYRPQDPAAVTNPPRPSERLMGTVTFEPRIYGAPWGVRAELRPSLRIAASETSIRTDEEDRLVTRSLKDVFHTLRLAAAIEPASALSLSASVATGTRLPSISELFGDRVYNEPNTDLRPERSTAVDLSAVLRGRSGALRSSLEVRGFGLWIDDLIRFERTAQYTVQPENVAEGRIFGLEAGVLGEYGRHLELTSTLTLLHTRNQFGNALPLRPPLQFLVRPTGHLDYGNFDRISLFAEVHHISFVYLDEANRSLLPERTLFGLGLSVTFFDDMLALQGRVDNLFDQQPTDYLSRPLPGRAFKLSLTVRTETGYE